MPEDKKREEFNDEVLLCEEDIIFSLMKAEGFDIFEYFKEGLENVDLDAIKNP